MANVGCRIRKEFERPDRKLIEAFKDIPVANIDDCMNRTAAVDSQLKPMNKARLLGTAFTVKAPAGDNLMFHKALDMAKPGDVLVIATFGSQSRSLCGEIMTRYAYVQGAGRFCGGRVYPGQRGNRTDNGFPGVCKRRDPQWTL